MPYARHELVIPNWTPATLNQLTRGRFSDRVKLAKADKEMVGTYFKMSDIPGATTPRRVSLKITVGPGERRCDPDGLWKSSLDALKACGAIVNDSAVWVQLGGIEWERAETMAGRQTLIILEDLESE
jgi:hypothetical protein